MFNTQLTMSIRKKCSRSLWINFTKKDNTLRLPTLLGSHDHPGVYHQMNAKFIKGDIEIPWTQESFKTFWKQIQNTMFEIESTTEIQSDKVAKVYDAINRGLVERTGVHIPFPSKELMEK